MRVKEINTSELEINESGMMTVFVCAGFSILGIAMLFAPLRDLSQWWLALVGLAIIGACVATALFLPKNRHAVLRKGGNSDVTETRTLTKKVLATTSFATADIVGVGLDTNTRYERDRDSNGSTTMREVRRSRLFLTLQNGSQILLGMASKSGANMNMSGGFSISSRSLINSAPLTREANQIATFLNVPLNGNTAGMAINGLVEKAVDTISNGLFGGNQPEQPEATQPQGAQTQPVVPTPIGTQPVSPPPVQTEAQPPQSVPIPGIQQPPAQPQPNSQQTPPNVPPTA